MYYPVISRENEVFISNKSGCTIVTIVNEIFPLKNWVDITEERERERKRKGK